MSVLGLLRVIASPTHSSAVPRQDPGHKQHMRDRTRPEELSPTQVVARSRRVSETLRGCELGSLPRPLSEKGSVLMA